MINVEFGMKSLDLVTIKKSLICLCALTVSFILFDLLLQPSLMKTRARGVIGEENYINLKEEMLSLSDYETAFKNSSLFGSLDEKKDLPILSSSMNELMKDLRLKGVVIMEEPEAILMDARTNQSTFVRVGEKVGELTVSRIQEGSITLSYYGEEKELRVT